MECKIGNEIKKIRKGKKISQSELARRTKSLNQSQICKIENGDRFVRVKDVEKIADALNVSIKQIIS